MRVFQHTRFLRFELGLVLADTGPLFHPLSVGGEFREYFRPSILVLASGQKRGLKFVGALIFGKLNNY
jgi:hypothetical protein